eukprot:15408309-Alexandrium_andersonii.AAC.1
MLRTTKATAHRAQRILFADGEASDTGKLIANWQSVRPERPGALGCSGCASKTAGWAADTLSNSAYES